MSRWLRHLAQCLAVGIALGALFLSPLGQKLERSWGLGALYLVRGPIPAPPGALVIGLDEASAEWLSFHAADPARVSDVLPSCLTEETRQALLDMRNILELPRGVHACLLNVMAARGAPVVAFDILFHKPRPDDFALASALRDGPTAILLETIDRRQEAVLQGALKRERPLPALRDAASDTAFFLVGSATGSLVDGFVTGLAGFTDLTSMPEAVLARHSRTAKGRLVSSAADFRHFWLYGPAKTVPTVPLRAVFDRSRPLLPERLEHTAIFVGISDPARYGETDHFRTAMSGGPAEAIGGVEIAATAMLNRLHGHLMHRPDDIGMGIWVAIVGFLGAASLRFVGGWRGVRVLIIGGFVMAAGTAAAFAIGRLWLPVAVPFLVGLPALALLGTAWRYAQARNVLRRRLARPVIGAVLDAFEDRPLGMTEVPGTVLFVDIVGSVGIGEALGVSSYTRRLVNFQNASAAAVERGGGEVVEFEGDSMLAVFAEAGAGRAHPAAACRAALSIIEAAGAGADGAA
ncbi:MAG: CHASE2 domain-containing protein, partial [Pseudomonadota bacterium]